MMKLMAVCVRMCFVQIITKNLKEIHGVNHFFCVSLVSLSGTANVITRITRNTRTKKKT